MFFITKIFSLFIAGNEISNIHKILKLKQSDWLKKYIEFNTDKRKNVSNSSHKRSF